ncbi:MAG: hypothetical protein PHF57_02510 [Methanoregula sp.]|nr:hypothetical protein [Methanoregula sp.]MDD5024114.1 hypothetical protein [Methanoregula sp.]MDD5187060.1 hypothetical protein [Methanoregula sp.]
MYLPIFHEDREFAFSVLTEAMKNFNDLDMKLQRDYVVDFYEIAEDIGSKRTNGLFIGPEAVRAPHLDDEGDAYTRGLYIFTVDFKEKKIVTVR